MSLMDFFQLPYAVSGLGVGFIAGLSGIGGGALMTPLLVLFFGMHPATAVGTDLLYASITKGFGTLVHGLGRSIEWRIVALLACGSVPAAVVTTLVLHSYGAQNPETAALITKALAYALVITSLSLMFRGTIQRLVARSPVGLSERRSAIGAVVLGAVMGVLVTVSSIGAGSIGVTILVILYPHMPTYRIVGTDIAHAVPLTAVAGLGHLAIGTVDMSLLGSLISGSIPGVIIGSLLSSRVPEKALRVVLATVLMLVSVLLILK